MVDVEIKAIGKSFAVTMQKGEEGYCVGSVELPGCHMQGRTLKELDRRVREANELNSGVMQRG
jgi:predicted RNase H-like HicB family nuclease